jgi:exoribonuclease R
VDFSDLRRELELPTQFPLAAQREADEAVAVPDPDPSWGGGSRTDRTDVPFVTIDPAESRDLDQAVCLSRLPGGGYRVRYAIADVAAYVRLGGALEAETWRRGVTVYLPDAKVPLHPESLSEGTASLLPDVDRAAVLWTIDLDADGATTAASLERAVVRSRAKLDYVGVQRDVDAGTVADPIALLPDIGRLLLARGLARGAINLPMPEQEIQRSADDHEGGWRLVLRAPVPVEEYNAQISLLTGMTAADIMLRGGLGLLRTMPAAAPQAVERLRAAAKALRIDWPDGASVGQVVASVDPGQPRAAAFLDQAAELMRGAGYTAFDGPAPAEPAHGAVAAPYAHVTAPLRRLADRYATEVCLALHDGRSVPGWTRDALGRLPDVMVAADRVASTAERGAIDEIEAVLLADRVGEQFDAAVVDVDAPPKAPDERRQPGGSIALDQPPVRARCEGELPLGERIRVRLVSADPKQRKVLFCRA